jgi:ketosteroid isomerase-like protein
MAARKKSSRKKTTASKSAPVRRTTRQAAAGASAKKAGTRAKRAPSSKKSAKSASKAPTVEQLSRKIVRMTLHSETLDLTELYSDAIRSQEPRGEPSIGLAALRQKFEAFEAMIRHQRWEAVRTWIEGSSICIEWHAELETVDGRELRFDEVAIHEVRAGKIAEERFYYDPAVLAAPQTKPAGTPAPGPTPVVPTFDDGPPPIDPLDL